MEGAVTDDPDPSIACPTDGPTNRLLRLKNETFDGFHSTGNSHD